MSSLSRKHVKFKTSISKSAKQQKPSEKNIPPNQQIETYKETEAQRRARVKLPEVFTRLSRWIQVHHRKMQEIEAFVAHSKPEVLRGMQHSYKRKWDTKLNAMGNAHIAKANFLSSLQNASQAYPWKKVIQILSMLYFVVMSEKPI